jgi:two-component system NtrC family response regulator
MARILIVDDDPKICELLSTVFRQGGHETVQARTLAAAREQAGDHPHDVVFLDLQMPDGSGMDHIQPLAASPGRPEIIILTGHGSPDGAELAITSGAWDYLEKPPTLKDLHLCLRRALDYHSQKSAPSPATVLDRSGLVGDSPALNACLAAAAQAAASEASVLVTGETGVGKELVSEAIHRSSPRRQKAFVVVDCAALPETLAESILFGHQKGAFTGAVQRSAGLLAEAHGGTLFLDEVGELPLEMQKKLLRALQERRFRPVGAEREASSDFRVVAATNRDLEAMTEEGSFRRDLWFRLQAMQVEVPPLRERKSDLKPLTQHFCNQLCERYGINSKGFSPDFFEALEQHHWPGNVRELANTVEWVLARALEAPTLFARHLPTAIRAKAARQRLAAEPPAGPAPSPPAGQPPLESLSLKEYRNQAADRAEREYLAHLLERHGDDPGRAQEVAGLSKSRFYSLLQKHGLTPKA